MQFKPDDTYLKYQAVIAKMKALRDGVTALRNKTYLPIREREEPTSYDNRSKQTILTNYTEKTVNASKGMLFRKPLAYGDLKLNDTNVDTEGQSLNRFAQDVAESGLWFGHSCIMVDAPSREGVTTLADEKAAGLEPYFVMVERDDIISFDYTYINGKAVLTEIIIKEKPEDPKNERYRVLNIGGGAIYEGKGEEFTVINEWTNTLSYIPITTFYTRKKAPLESKPMFENIADLNIRHFNLDSKKWMMTEYMVPQLKIWGRTVEDDETGGNTQAVNSAWEFQDKESGDVEWLTYNGKEIEIIEKQMTSEEQRMATIGLSMLSSKDSSKEQTATERSIDSAQENSDMASIAQNLEDALSIAYEMWCDMAGTQKGDETISVNREFISELLSPEEMKELREEYSAGLLDKETFWQLMESGGRFKGVDIKLLKARVEAQGPDFAAG